MARHLATCDRKSAYESSEVAQTNTVKCNMLDMLGLVRRDGEEEEDSSEGLLIPADQQQQLLSKSIERDNEKAQSAASQSSTTVPPPNAMDDFNTQLSLDDLAPPQSVAPQEPDRTPQLTEEYQVSPFNLQMPTILAYLKLKSFHQIDLYLFYFVLFI